MNQQPQEERPNDENAQLWTEEARKEYEEWCQTQDKPWKKRLTEGEESEMVR